MVTIIDAVQRKNSQDGNSFISLIVQGEIEIVKSENGNFYASARKCSLPSTLALESAKLMVGNTLPGNIVKVECTPYEHLTQDGELVYLNHRYQYVPEESNIQNEEQATMEETIQEQELAEEVV